jgi:hypothetical protein
VSLLGGSANKLGNRYELWWTVVQVQNLLLGQWESIRLEVPGSDKIEFELALPDTGRPSSGLLFSTQLLDSEKTKWISHLLSEVFIIASHDGDHRSLWRSPQPREWRFYGLSRKSGSFSHLK